MKTVCIVGGGLAGGIVGAVLAARGHPVTLVELGDAPSPLHPLDEIWEQSQIRAPFTRASGIGGTSNFWHGGLTVLDKSDVEDTGHRGGQRAPIAYQELRRYYARAVELFADGKQRYSLGEIEAPSVPVTDGFDCADPFRVKALLYPNRPFSSAGLIEHAREMHGLRVVRNVEIRRLRGSGNRRVSYAEGVDIRSGADKGFDADVFVLAAGGLGSPKILLRSGGDCPALGRLPVGRFLIDHPTGFVFKARLRQRVDLGPLFGTFRDGYRLQYGFALAEDRRGLADRRNHIVYLRPASSMTDPSTYDLLKRKLVSHRGRALGPLDFARLLWHGDLLFDVINFKFGLLRSTRHVSGFVFAEQFPDDNSRVSLAGNGRFSIKWRFSQADRRSLEKFVSVFFRSHSHLFEAFDAFPDLDARLDSAAHHSGGCRMASSPADGVVDADLRVFGIDNVFVADGSVLPYAGHANTGLTIAALALKCCDAVSAA